jgi:hypothetical protein
MQVRVDAQQMQRRAGLPASAPPGTVLMALEITGTAEVVRGGADGRKLAAIRRLCRRHIEDGKAAEPAGPLCEQILALVEARDVDL